MFVLPQCKQDAVCRRAPRDKNREGNAKKKKDKKKRQPKKAEDSICSKEKTAMRQVIRRWSDPSRGRRREQQYSYSISGIGQILYRK